MHQGHIRQLGGDLAVPLPDIVVVEGVARNPDDDALPVGRGRGSECLGSAAHALPRVPALVAQNEGGSPGDVVGAREVVHLGGVLGASQLIMGWLTKRC